jgi:hypothetical protein
MTSTQLVAGQPAVRYKILMYHAGDGYWLYPAVLHLKTYIDVVCPEICNQLDWLLPIQHTMTDDELLAHIHECQPDVLCTSHYVWNHNGLINQLTNIKSKINKNIKIIAGGPSINVNLDADFFKKYPAIDFAVYGPGEQAFADIIKSQITNVPLKAFNTSNCGWVNPNTGQQIVAPYKFVKMISTSPFATNQQLFSLMCNSMLCPVGELFFPYTLTRGCPYTCTFCDWNSGLGTKVSRRKNTYQQEIDLFQQLGIKKIFLADANVGQYDEDVDMIEYFAEKNIKENAGFHVGGNFSKLKKENNLKIFHSMAQSGLVNKTLNFSIQDVNQEVLNNIDRPDVGWDVHVAMANELRIKYPHLIVKAQLIYGLPGQTPASWRQTLATVTQQNILPIIFLNEPLPASPAMYNPEYQRKFQFEYIHSNRIGNSLYLSKIPKKSMSFDQHDLVQMNLLSAVYKSLSTINFALRENHAQSLDVEKIVDQFITSEHWKNLYNNLYNNWTIHNNFYYTIDFSGQTVQIPDIALGLQMPTNTDFLKYISTFVSIDHRNKFFQTAIQAKFQKTIKEIQSDID